MATKYFCKDVNNQATCDAGTTDLDLDKTQGTGTTVVSAATQSGTFVETLTFDIDVSADSPSTGTQAISLDVSGVTANVEYRFRAQAIDDAGCSVTASTTYSSLFTATGIRTLSASLTWAAGDERLRISIETRKTGGHGNQAVTVNVNDADSFIDAPWSASSPINISATVNALVLAEQDASVNAETSIVATVDALTLTEYDATIDLSLDINIAASVDALTLTEYDAGVSLDLNITATVDALALAEYDATVELTSDIDIAATVDALTLAEFDAGVNAETSIVATVDALTLTPYDATVSVGGSINIAATVDTLTLVPYPAGVNAETSIAASVASLALSTYDAVITTVQAEIEHSHTGAGFGPPRRKKIPKRYRPKTTRDIIAELQDKDDEELQIIVEQAIPPAADTISIDDWIKRKLVVDILLAQRKKLNAGRG